MDMNAIHTLEFCGAEDGGADEGGAVIILEGWATGADVYRAMAARLAANGKRALVPDLPGFGKSPEPPRAWSAADYAEFLNDFCAYHKVERCTLIGHSHGGRVIIKAVGGGTFKPRLEKIVLIDSAGIVHANKKKPKLSYRIIRFLLRPFPRLLDRYKSTKGSADYRAASPVMRETLVKLVNEDLRELLPNINAPTLLIWGENDADTPLADAKLMEAAIPDAGLVTVPGAGHYCFLDNPNLVYAVLDSFL